MHEHAIAHLSQDPVLCRLIQRVGPCRLRADRQREPFAALVRSVTFQQLNGTAAETIFNRFLALFGHDVFPSPEQILAMPIEKMRSAGLSGAKTAAIRDIATKAHEGVVPTRAGATKLSDAELVERLTTIRGVGPWTVEMLLIFTLGRKDVFPVTDFGVRKGFAIAHGLQEMPKPRELLPHGERWRPYRSIASWYLWRAADAAK